MLDEAKRAQQTVTSDWKPVGRQLIAGVEIAEIKNVFTRSGVLTECFQPAWFGSPFELRHVVYVTLMPGGVSHWHCHKRQTDIIVVVHGQLRIGLYDDRPDSGTYRQFSLVNAGIARPSALRVPPLVWHGIKNPGSADAAYVVMNDEPYNYEEPDDWILPPGSNAIPHRLE